MLILFDKTIKYFNFFLQTKTRILNICLFAALKQFCISSDTRDCIIFTKWKKNYFSWMRWPLFIGRIIQ